jgi:hypothetical protein
MAGVCGLVPSAAGAYPGEYVRYLYYKNVSLERANRSGGHAC